MSAVLKKPTRPYEPSSVLDLLDQEFAQAAKNPCGERGPGAEPLRRALLEPVRYVLDRPGKELRAQLIRLAYRLAGGRDTPPASLLHLIELLHAGSLVIDDVEDASVERRGRPSLHRRVGVPLAINAGNWLYFWAFDLVPKLGFEAARELEVYRQLSHTLELAHRGQALDLGTRVTALGQSELPVVASAIAEGKTGALTGCAARLGALAAAAPGTRVEVLARFGFRMGLALQRLDDLGGLINPRLREKGIEDLRLERVTWVWAWLAQHLDERAFLELRAELGRSKDEQAIERLHACIAAQLVEQGAALELKRRLEQILRQLENELGAPAEALQQVAEHLKRLEESYV